MIRLNFRPLRLLVLSLATLSPSACFVVVPVPISAPAATPSSEPVRSTASFTGGINSFRADNGVGALQQSAILTRAAQAHAEDMAARGYFSHQSPGGPNGDDLGDRARAAGCSFRSVAENIAQGQRSEAEVLTGWANSPGHRRNMLNGRMTDYGLGRAGDIWVLKLSSGC